MNTSILPTVNAILNATSGILIVIGFIFIKRKQQKAHMRCMLGAVASSVLFLISYLTYHYTAGATSFLGEGWIRPVYFTILATHTLLAIVIVPMVAITVLRGLSGRYALHRKIARWTFPIWLYVSVTGVVIYVLLYHLYPSAPAGI
jgi:uncharacterized membrane protein YozB (DUF420 family)